MARPKVNVEGQKELDKIKENLSEFQDSARSITLDQTRLAPKVETEAQTKIAQSEKDKMPDVYLKPKRIFPSREKFNEKFRDEYNYLREYVEFIAENDEVKGEAIDFCIKKFPGIPIEEWVVPVNKPVWAPRYVKQRIEECGYTVFTTMDNPTAQEGGVTYYGQMVAQQRKQRLSVREVSKKKNIYMGYDRIVA